MTYSSSIPKQQLPAAIPVSPTASLSSSPPSQKVDETVQAQLEQLKLENSRLKEENNKLRQDCIGSQTTSSRPA